jgi:glycosyltransferase involved in cell wall biosynthesis
MDITFLGGIFPAKIKQTIIQKSKGIVQFAADSNQSAIIHGLDIVNKKPIHLINLPFVGDFPLHYKNLFLPSFKFAHTKESDDINLGFFNFFIINSFSKYFSAIKALKQWSKKPGDKKLIVVYGLFPYLLSAASKIKKLNPTVKLCVIVPDLPEFMGGNMENYYTRVFVKVNQYFNFRALKNFDSFVLLSEHMVSKLPILNKPWIRVEGIFDDWDEIQPAKKEEGKIILYSGTIAKRYGIMNLIDAFKKIVNSDYRLWICGEGDCREIIEDLAKTDNRIEYFGQKHRMEILTLQRKATVLINPRISNGEFTKYSFPSKILEYLASGTPCIMYRLKGIPEEYFNYCYIPENENSESLKNAIMIACEKPQSELDEFGKKAAQFIKEQKNPTIQGKKIYDLLDSL